MFRVTCLLQLPFLTFCWYRYPKLLILFIPATCTGELQPLDVGFNGLWKVFITKFANTWLSENIMQQLRVNPDPTTVKLGLKKSDLVAPFCGWIAAATLEMKTRSAPFTLRVISLTY